MNTLPDEQREPWLVGGAIGGVGAYPGLKFLPRTSRSLGMLVYAMVMSPRNIAYGITIAAAIGVLSSFIPAFFATRTIFQTSSARSERRLP